MKAKKISLVDLHHIYFFDEEGILQRVMIPQKLRGSDHMPRIEDGKIKIGRYVYNSEKNTWEKISKILLFLQSILEAIKNIFQ